MKKHDLMIQKIQNRLMSTKSANCKLFAWFWMPSDCRLLFDILGLLNLIIISNSNKNYIVDLAGKFGED